MSQAENRNWTLFQSDVEEIDTLEAVKRLAGEPHPLETQQTA